MNALTTLALLVSNFSFRLADKDGRARGSSGEHSRAYFGLPKGGMLLHCMPRCQTAARS
eukprot:jgi/Botrbrau1/18380/Bobra.0886s0001.1